MASTVSTVLRLELQADGENENTWGLIANRNFEVLERAGAGHKDLAIAGATTTLTATANQLGDWHYHSFKCTGTLTANSVVVVPNQSRVYLFENATTGAFTLTVKTAAGTGVVIPTGRRAVLTCDGTNVTGVVLHPYDAVSYLPLGGGTVTGKVSVTLNTSTDDGVAQVTISSNRNSTSNPTTPNIRVQSFAPSIAFRDTTTGQENRDVYILRDQNFLSFRYDAAGDGVLTVPFSMDVSTGITTLTGAIRGTAGTVGAPAFSFSGDTNSGVRSGGTDIVSIVTNGADRLNVDASGNVGVNMTAINTADSRTFSIKGPNSGSGWASVTVEGGTTTKRGLIAIGGADGDIQVGTAATNTTGALQLFAGGANRVTVKADGTVNPTGNILWPTPGVRYIGYAATTMHAEGNAGSVSFGIDDGGGFSGVAVSNYRTTASLNSQNILFNTSNGGIEVAKTRMAIGHEGNIFLGQTSTPYPGFSVDGSVIGGSFVGGQGRLFLSMNDFSQFNRIGDGAVLAWSRSGAQVGTVAVTTTTTSYNTSSDYRLKTEVEPLTGALDRLAQLQPKRFRWIATPDAPKVDGFLAHEAQAVVPEAVTGELDGVDFGGNPEFQQIDQGKLIPLLVAAVQELRAQVAALQNP